MKKLLVVLMILVSLMPVFAGGGQQSGAQAGKGEVINGVTITTPKDTKAELVFWHHQAQAVANFIDLAKVGTEILQKYGFTNMTMRSEQVEYANYMSKYVTAFQSGTGPDLFMAKVSDFAMDGGANPVALALPNDIGELWRSKEGGLYKEEGWYNGKFYGPLVAGDTIMLLYINADHMKEAGLDPAKDYPKNFAEFLALAQKLTKYDASGKITRSGFQPRYTGAGDMVGSKFIATLHNFGGRVLAPDLSTASGYMNSAASMTAFQFYHDIVFTYKVCNPDFGHPDTAFQSGQASMHFREPFYAGETMAKNPNLNFIVVPYCVGSTDLSPGATAVNTLGSGSWHTMVNAQSKYTDVVTLIMKELCNPQYDIRIHTPNQTPPILAENININNSFYKTLPYAQALIDSMDWPLGPIYDTFAEWTPVQTCVGEAVADIVLGKDVKTSVENAVQKINVILSQRQK